MEDQQKENKGGRPTKYKPEYAEQAYELCLLGVTDAQLATYFEVNEDTIHEWKKVHPEFSESLRRGKLQADGKIAAALFKRALGFQYDETTWEKIELKAASQDDIKIEAFKRKVVTKTVVPDTGAITLWLKNRQKELWRDNELDFDSLTDEQLDKLLDRIMVKAFKDGHERTPETKD